MDEKLAALFSISRFWACPIFIPAPISFSLSNARLLGSSSRSGPWLRRIAVFDVVTNNADRKGGHVLVGGDDRVYGVDHGLTLHVENKLRTVLWGWIGDTLSDAELDALRTLRRVLNGDLASSLGEHVTRREVAALRSRVDGLLNAGCFPEPNGYGPAIPWPAF